MEEEEKEGAAHWSVELLGELLGVQVLCAIKEGRFTVDMFLHTAELNSGANGAQNTCITVSTMSFALLLFEKKIMDTT